MARSVAGSTRERSPGVWELRAFLGRDPVTGKPRQMSRTFHGGKRQAEKELAKLVSEASNRKTVPTTDTFGHLLDRWIAELERKGYSPLYISTAKAAIAKRIRAQLGDIKLPALTSERLDSFYSSMHNEGLADGTIRLYHKYIQSALSLAVRWDWIDRSPATRASPPQWGKRIAAPPSVPDVRRLIETAQARNPDLATLFFIAASTGMRRGELCGLRWSDIDLDTGSIVVTRSVIKVNGHLESKAPKSGKARRLSIDPATLMVLQGHRAICEARWPLGRAAYVWSYHPGNERPLIPGSVTQFFMNLRQECGLDHVRLHDLRHFSVTTLLTAGVDVRTVSGRHGHQNPTMTLELYGHFMQSADVEAAKIMGELLRPTAVTAG